MAIIDPKRRSKSSAITKTMFGGFDDFYSYLVNKSSKEFILQVVDIRIVKKMSNGFFMKKYFFLNYL